MSSALERVESHNSAETTEWGGGRVPYRLPEAVRNRLNPRGRMVGRMSAGSQIRFVSDAPTRQVEPGNIDPERVLQVCAMRGEPGRAP